MSPCLSLTAKWTTFLPGHSATVSSNESCWNVFPAVIKLTTTLLWTASIIQSTCLTVLQQWKHCSGAAQSGMKWDSGTGQSFLMWDFVESLKRLVLLNPKWRATCENLDPTVWQWQWHWLWSLILKGCAWGASMASCACVNPWKQASAALLSVHKFSPCKSQFWFIALLNQILVRTSLSASAEAISCKTSNHPQTAVQCAHTKYGHTHLCYTSWLSLHCPCLVVLPQGRPLRLQVLSPSHQFHQTAWS